MEPERSLFTTTSSSMQHLWYSANLEQWGEPNTRNFPAARLKDRITPLQTHKTEVMVYHDVVYRDTILINLRPPALSYQKIASLGV